MSMKNVFAVALTLGLSVAAQAQDTTTCSCNPAGGIRTTNSAALQTLLSNKMVCANVGSEVWQEWHNGGASGVLEDYKLGPGVQPDPSAPVGTYTINTNNTVTYAYSGGGGTYTYDVCLVSGSYTFCGAQYGGRNITGARIGGAGLTPCSAVSNAVVPNSTTTRKR